MVLALVLKISLAPALVATATLAARRAGHGIAGMISGLPVVAGPIVLVLAVQDGVPFAHGAAAGAVLGVASLVGFCVAYGLVARRAGAHAALVAGGVAYALGTVVFSFVRPGLVVSIVITAAAIAAGIVTLGRAAAAHPVDVDLQTGRDLLALRLLITVVLVLALTAIARGLSPHLAGLLTPFPIITSVMAVFTQVHAGGPAAISLLSGLTRALTSFLAFFAVLAWGLGAVAPAAAFGLATAAALLTWAATVTAVLTLRRADGARTGGSRRGGSTAAPSAYRSAP